VEALYPDSVSVALLPDGSEEVKGPFSMVLRLYWPKADALSGSWAPPPIKRVEWADACTAEA
jgi:hypothetical protein